MNPSPAVVAFDLYGTLIRFGLMHHPFRKLLLWARDQGRKPRPDDARKIMTADMGCEELLAEIGVFPSPDRLAQIHREIQEELNRLTLFDDVLPVLNALTDAGIPLAICSNLAKPYGVIIDRLLPQFNFIKCLSYTVGAIKPDKEIYDAIVNGSGVSPEQILFVGDTWLADYDGPRRYGFQAKHLVRDQHPATDSISSLKDLLQGLR